MIITTFPEHAISTYYSSGFYSGVKPKTIGVAGRFDSPRAVTLRVASGWINIRYTFSTKYSSVEVNDPDFDIPEGEANYVDWSEEQINKDLFPILSAAIVGCFDTTLINRLLNCTYLEPTDQLVAYLANRSILGAAKAVSTVESLIERHLATNPFLDAATIQPQIIGGQLDPVIMEGGSSADAVVQQIIQQAIGINLKERNEELANSMQLQIRIVKLSFVAAQYFEEDPTPDNNGFELPPALDSEETTVDLEKVRYVVASNELNEYLGVYEIPIGSYSVNYIMDEKPEVMADPADTLSVDFYIIIDSSDSMATYFTRLSASTTLKDMKDGFVTSSASDTDSEASIGGDDNATAS